MKKIIILAIIIFFAYTYLVIARAGNKVTPVQAAVIAPVDTQYVAPTFISSATPIPSPTIGYEATLFIAQGTADEARRVNAVVTAQYEQLILSYAQLTHDTEYQSFQVQSWTAQAGPTIIPLTATQQVYVNTQVAEGQSIASGFLTATHEAPTQMAAIANIQDSIRYVQVDRAARWVMILSISIFCIGVAVFMFRWSPPERQPKPDPEKETIVQLRRDMGQGSFSQVRTVIPCSPEQLTELAELAANGEKKFGINRLERDSRTFRSQRETLIKVREWLQTNNFVIQDAGGSVMLNDAGEEFLSQWFDLHKLPEAFEFDEEPELEKKTGDGFIPLRKDGNGYHFGEEI